MSSQTLPDTIATNLAECYLAAAHSAPHRVALRFKRGADLEFQSWTWAQLHAQVTRLALWLLTQGVAPGDRVAQFSENRPEWVCLDLACHLVGAVHVAVHAPLSGRQLLAQLIDCDARLLLLSTPTQQVKLSGLEASWPTACTAWSWDASPEAPPFVRHLTTELESPPFDLDAPDPQAWPGLLSSPHQLATLIYTSGTTGEPKGVMLTHRNLLSNALSIGTAFEMTQQDVKLCWLPLSHVFARTCDLYTWLTFQHQLVLAGSRETIFHDCRNSQATLTSCVPYFFLKLKSLLMASAEKSSETQNTLHNWQSVLGTSLRACGCGGAPLNQELAEYFHERKLLILQGYGLSETSPVISSCTRARFRAGSVGPPLPGIDVQIAPDGEIATRGPHIMAGYWRQPHATAEVMRSGWFHTGDLGHLDGEGFLWITGRKKELLVLNSGKKVVPTVLESQLTQDPWILQALFLGNGQNFLTALLVPNWLAVRTWLQTPLDGAGLEPSRPPDTESAGDTGSACTNTNAQPAWLLPAAALAMRQDVQAEFARRVAAALQDFSHWEQLSRFALLATPWTVEAGELTPKLSLCRDTIAERYAAEIARLYP